MNEAKLTARKLQMTRLGFFPVGLSRKELQEEWAKLVEKGKVPALVRGALPGEYERHMTRRSSRARPGRKKHLRCNSCGNTLGKYHNFGLCDHCISTGENKITKMHIPKMTKK